MAGASGPVLYLPESGGLPGSDRSPALLEAAEMHAQECELPPLRGAWLPAGLEKGVGKVPVLCFWPVAAEPRLFYLPGRNRQYPPYWRDQG